ncbi:uncharacterized protein LOC111706259 [Eurytemora carolleeae]|uniref:uncharacterized protein LOC111706259 n=1 Tax=Eurytemora carolleeae TaxID=1294199 RepID=UPI000C7831F3|nr:uncharacterized protein LOC111706259 [Eurytemora carolleeae]|eukprot:XP_023334859.1 uncharacterized protein LOC111706259 [Eurytemora affinis]
MSTLGGGRAGTPDPRRRSNPEPDPEGGEGVRDSHRNSSRFDLKVDVHMKPGGAVGGEETTDSLPLPKPDEVIDIDSKSGDVVILVDEETKNHKAHAQTILDESKQSAGVSFDASQGEVSFSSTSSQLTMPGAGRVDGTRRYSNISNLAQSVRSEAGINPLQPVTGSLEILPTLDPNLAQLGNRRRLNQTKSGRNVRRTKSVLDTGMGCVAPMSLSSYPVSLEAGMNTDFSRKGKSLTQAFKSLDIQESQISEASEDGSVKEGEAALKEASVQLTAEDMGTCDEDSAETLEKHLDKEPRSSTRRKSVDSNISGLIVCSTPSGSKDTGLDIHQTESVSSSHNADILDISEIGSSNDWDTRENTVAVQVQLSDDNMEEEEKETHQEQEQEQEKEEKETEQELKQENKEIEGTDKKDKKEKTNMNDENDDNHIKNETDEKNETTSTLSPIRLENEVTRTEEIDRDEVEKTASILSNVRMDWMFSDSEPDEPPNSPKQVPAGSHEERVVRQLESSLQTRDLPRAQDSLPVKSRDSSHGSSGTDTETRTLLNKLEEVEASLGACGNSYGGAIPKRRVRNSGGRERRFEARDTVDRDETDLPVRSTLHEDAAGLKLFLDLLNGHETQNPESEAELRKLIRKKRNRIEEESGTRDPEVHGEVRGKRRLASRRKRRHAAEPQTEEHFPPTEIEEENLRLRGEDSLKTRIMRRRDRQQLEIEDKDDKDAKEGKGTHFAENHEDTTAGAVHCYQDEYGNWHSYTFGIDGWFGLCPDPAQVQDLQAGIGRQFSTETGGSRRTSRDDEKVPGGGWNTESTAAASTVLQSHSSSDSGLTVILDSPAMVFQPTAERQRSRDSNAETFRDRDAFWTRETGNSGRYNVAASSQAFRRYNPLSMFAENLFDRLPGQTLTAAVPDLPFHTPEGSGQLTRLEESSIGRVNLSTNSAHLGSIHSNTPKIRKYHILNIPGTKGLKVWLDRLTLLNILDQDPSMLHTIISIILATATAILGSQVIQEGYFKDLQLVLFCLVLCSSQYSLLKSVQPDASSPTHGFNSTTVYSRPVYFVIFCSIVLILETVLKGEVTPFRLYGILWGERFHLEVIRNTLYIILLAFPVIFTLGLLPQINTAAMFVLEQIDIQIFGGNASSSIQSSVYCVSRSILANVILVGFAYGGLTERTHSVHAQQVLFSIFCSLAVPMSYHLSRSSGDPTVILSILKRHILAILSEDVPLAPHAPGTESPSEPELQEESPTPGDPLPKKLRDTVNSRLKNDIIVCVLLAVVVFLVVQSDVLDKTFPHIDIVLWSLALIVGVVLHYIIPHLRKENPWKCIASPVLKSHEHRSFEVRQPAKVMWWEKFLLWAVILEKSVLYPLIFLSAVYQDKGVFSDLFGLWGGSMLMSICLLKSLRICFSDSSRQYMILLFSILLFQFNPTNSSITNIVVGEVRQSPFLLDYFLTSILVLKILELYLKCQFVITYTAPHQINWGSAFHAFAQPFSVPHSAMLFLQAAVSSALSSPLNPFLGSTIFLCSYARENEVEMRNPGADDNNLNSIFYEHLTRSLQHSLAGDILLGRWGEVQQGDFFVLASDYLNCLVHIIELGNGLCTFQVRGLEFRGTYCHQREVEAISEGVEDDEGCCCCEPGHLPHLLSLNAALSQRWLAWEVTATRYVLEGYSISDNSAQSMLQVYDLRKILVSYYIKSIIYYTVRSPKLQEWLENPCIRDAIRITASKNFVDLDPLFNSNIDEDFDFRSSGISRNSFCNIYLSWIQHCTKSRDKTLPAGKDSDLVSLCLSLSVLGRRALGAAGHNALSTVEFFLVGLHALFKGDFRITSVRDEWVFSDMELLRKVVAPGVRMSLKLHQDHFMSPDEYEDPSVLYEAITSHEKDLVISHEGDPAWRTAVLSGAQSLLALRHVMYDGADEYKIIMLNKRFLSFRVIKLNRECVRGLWAGQQQELIFLRNRNPERGSIQNAKQALRNIINSSCDQPLGYPIYVSPLTTSYSDTNKQVCGVVGGPLSLGVFKTALWECWSRVRDKCIGSCTTGSSGVECDINTVDGILPEHLRGASLPGNRSSVVSSVSKPSSGTLVSLAGLLGSQSLPSGSTPPTSLFGPSTIGGPGPVSSIQGTPLPPLPPDRPTPPPAAGQSDSLGPPAVRVSSRKQYPVVRILDPLMVYDNINLGRRIDPIWPEPEWRAKGGRNSWNTWIPDVNMKGIVLHRWIPMHPHSMYRSHTDKTILLVQIEDKYVPIAEHAVEIVYSDQDINEGTPKPKTSSSSNRSIVNASSASNRSPANASSRSPARDWKESRRTLIKDRSRTRLAREERSTSKLEVEIEEEEFMDMSGNKNLHPVSRSGKSTGYGDGGEELKEFHPVSRSGKSTGYADGGEERKEVYVFKDETNEDVEEEFTDKPQLTLVEKVYGERYPGVKNPETLVEELITRDQPVQDGSTPEAKAKKLSGRARRESGTQTVHDVKPNRSRRNSRTPKVRSAGRSRSNRSTDSDRAKSSKNNSPRSLEFYDVSVEPLKDSTGNSQESLESVPKQKSKEKDMTEDLVSRKDVLQVRQSGGEGCLDEEGPGVVCKGDGVQGEGGVHDNLDMLKKA